MSHDVFAQVREFSPHDIVNDLFNACPSRDPWDLVMYVDAKTYLHGLLVMEDKLSMAHSLETRVPLLDNELVDFVLDIPWSYLCDGKIGKIIFRESVKPWVSEDIYNKPKMGFGPPDASWYRGRLREWIGEQLSEKSIRDRGIFNPSYVSKALNEHNSGKKNNVYLIWTLLSFESWFRTFHISGVKLS